MEYLIFAIIGIIAGLLGGLLGIGGSIFIIPALILYFSFAGTYTGSSQHLIQAAAMTCNFCIALPAAIGHWRSRAVTKSLIKQMIPAAIVGVIVGVALSNMSVFAGDNGKYLTVMLGCFLLYEGLLNIWRIATKFSTKGRPVVVKENQIQKRVLFSGWLVGLVSGLLGIGGGALCVPIQQTILNVPLKNAIANSSCTIVSIVLIGAFYKGITLTEHGFQLNQIFPIVASIVPGAIISSYYSSRLTHYLSSTQLRWLFATLMLLLAGLIFYKVSNG